jgi:hypothetical protein
MENTIKERVNEETIRLEKEKSEALAALKTEMLKLVHDAQSERDEFQSLYTKVVPRCFMIALV